MNASQLLNDALKNLRLAQVLVKTPESRQALVESALAVKCVLLAENPNREKPVPHWRRE